MNMNKAVGKQIQGFTLIEIMVVLSIAVIITTVGIPSVMSTIASNRVSTAGNNLVTALNLAKSEAIRTNRSTVLCKSPDGKTCKDSAAWAEGWILFYDLNTNEQVDDGERIIRIQDPPHESLNFTFKTGDFIRFSPNGRNNHNGRFCFRNSFDEARSKAVIITQVGRIRTEYQATSICES